jgi:hypothetical protein
MRNAEVSVTRGERLFTKNTGHRKVEKPSMVADACSLPVPESGVQPEEGLVKSGGNSDPRLIGGRKIWLYAGNPEIRAT